MSACNTGDLGSIPGSGRSPGEGDPVFLPGESHGWRSLAGYSPRGCKESNTTERLDFTLTSLHRNPSSKWLNDDEIYYLNETRSLEKGHFPSI